jgi:hypothetical protein
MNNINNLLAALGDEINSLAQKGAADPKEIARKLPHRSLTGDHINGGKIQNFNSAGITDKSTVEQLKLSDNGVAIKQFSEGFLVNGNIQAEDVSVKILKADVIQAGTIVGKIEYANDTPVVFSGDSLEGKGLLWAGKGHTKQFIFAANPDRFFSSENIDLARGKSITVNNIKLFDEKELGPTVVKSNLREVGRLNGLIVDGDVSVGQYLTFYSATNRLALGTESPNAALSVCEDGIEVVVGTKDSVRGFIGTYASHSLDIVTDNAARITIAAGGNIQLGNPKLPPVQVSVHGKLSVRVATPDPEVDLHVAGAVKFANRLQTVGKTYPTAGTYNAGDIVWNAEPKINQYAGWICVQAGAPGLWEPFGKIGNS